ncbi:dihydroxyacetone kinase subunit L [Mycolicibacterium sp. 018/SC-01/001]|uniref:dihydroxyacetone kinase subunit DhaL n=1 Tax=Mycolicibacterium sp. 018/SC-01/001 TaxID=2592069 RepID=UPI00117E4738|nr:dihydroxyacetone kinase subunit DhaL [Mycolicibacterium sp. 018/SC-01/001]TRW88872.1 dihydroxyacetone kinase subunit L [Mycolicibacterium sp. 018/SC-01/001]
MSSDDVERRIVMGFVDAVEQAHPALTRFDQRSGDGDFGDNLRGGMRAVVHRLDQSEESPLSVLGSVFLDEVGGTSGPLLGLLFTEIAVAVRDRPSVAAAWATGLSAGLRAITRVGEAAPGDRTMIDAIAPAVETLSESSDMSAAAQAAEDGARRTADMRARMGRASYLGDRAKGEPDPGAAGFALFLWAVSSVVDGTTTPAPFI